MNASQFKLDSVLLADLQRLRDQNIAAFALCKALEAPQRTAFHYPCFPKRRLNYRSLTNAEFCAETLRLVAGLQASGLRPGARTLIMIDPRPEFFMATFAVFLCGGVPVFIDPGMSRASLKRSIESVEPEVLIGVPMAFLAKRALKVQTPTTRLSILVGSASGTLARAFGLTSLETIRERGAKTEIPRFLSADADEQKLAAILFTSGSTGPAKGVHYTHAMFLAQVRQLKKHFAIADGEVDLATFPLFSLFAPALGMEAVIPVMNARKPAQANPQRLAETIARFKVTNLFASPALLNRIAESPAASSDALASLRRIISAGAPVAGKIVRKMQASLPRDCEVFTPYGATEAMPVSIASSSEILPRQAETRRGRGVYIGRPLPDIDVRIVPISDDAITNGSAVEPGQIGEIAVSGAVASSSYFENLSADALAKFTWPNAEEGGRTFHRMGDLGYFDADGALWFCGRKSQRVRSAERDYFTVASEGLFLDLPGVQRAALVGVKDSAGERPVLYIEPTRRLTLKEQSAMSAQIRAKAKEHGLDALVQHVLFCRRFPVDTRHNAKIFREKLAAAASLLFAQGRLG